MQQLSGLDASFIYMETGSTPMHIGSLAIYDQSTAPGGHVTFKEILRFFEQRLHKARAFRQRMVRVPLSLDHPYWIEDPDFDLEFHVRHIALPKPGDWRQLCIQAARLHARPLDLRKPLWEAYVIEGLDNVHNVPKGSFALVTKMHHAAIDGVSGAEMAAAIHDLSPDAEVEGPEKPWEPERLPTGIELLGKSALRTVMSPARFGKLLYRSAPSLAKVVGGIVNRELKIPMRVPRTRFNGTVGAHRMFDGRAFDLNVIKAIKTMQPGTTVNDVIVSIVGGALRKYLAAKNELPDESLVAMAPMSIRPEERRGAAGNLVTAMSLPIRSDIADPLERLQAVNEESAQAKKLAYTMGPTLAADAAEFLPSTISGLIARTYASSGLADRVSPMVNTVISNIPGVGVPLYSMGSRMVATFGLGPLTHGIGLFQAVLSYNNTITISVVSDRDMLPDPSFYCRCLEDSFEELKAATIDRSPQAKSSGKRKKKSSGRGALQKKKNGSGATQEHQTAG
ncbi:MAG: wax ester/triacylglycerol synthase family O-acyltransferase [Gammaproteobacteria bacterium]|nr:wax ester/triacylglycerol synthase family O-acyltransferase [Gammaproteobacteria bacterium]MDH4315118.1 wax ester/triacylglycerol synthase family O-acyltransferase [Gammaproteobacteria bacterium]MDH5214259.1 wax ester/triacylglycerol synthase family O-acyltransferase [Gammaproteobacteria bacterium]MDH5500643.1 wax ester/triacylglycerol synthase family O-acyltransferase [Gammaproteobacteria bacterium]